MGRKTTIDKLPQKVRDRIGELRRNGRTIDEILAKLAELNIDVPRSTMGRHIQKIDKIGERLRETRQVTEALVAQFGENQDDKALRLNIELMMPVVMQLLTSEDDDGNVTLDAKDAMFLSATLKNLASARSSDSARQTKEREIFAKAAVEKVEAVAKSNGLTAKTVEDIKAAILGVKPGDQKP